MPAKQKPKIAAVVTTFFKNSHADVIVGKFLRGFPTDDGVVAPQVEIVSLYIDQVSGFSSSLPGLNEGFQLEDLGLFAARKYQLRVCGSIREALCLGTAELAVDGVLLIGERASTRFAGNSLQQIHYTLFFSAADDGPVLRSDGDYPLNELGQQMYPR